MDALHETLSLPLVSGGTYDFIVDWGDSTHLDSITSAYATHSYASAGEYTITIQGQIEGWSFEG